MLVIKQLLLIFCLLSPMGLMLAQVTPPELINYQGVLRDSAGNPINALRNMTFHFYDADGGPACTGGTLLLTDAHLGVAVEDGIFNVLLGGGTVTPGAVSSLHGVFTRTDAVHLEIVVQGETLCPRVRVVSSAFTLNTHSVRGDEIISDGALDLYVDGSATACGGSGCSDTNDGLSSATAKQTIQGGVNAIPEVLNGHVTVHIADGTYEEEVWVTSRGRRGVYFIEFIGNPTQPQNVVLDGTNIPEEPGIGFVVTDPAVVINGMTVSHYKEAGFHVASGGGLELLNCGVTDNDLAEGGILAENGFIDIQDCDVLRNATGIRAMVGSRVRFSVNAGVVMDMNTVGITADTNSTIEVQPPCTLTNSPLVVHDQSVIRGYSACTRDGASICTATDPPSWCADGP